MFETPKIELREGNLGVVSYDDGGLHFNLLWKMGPTDKAMEGLYGMDVEIPGCVVLYFDPGFKSNIRRVWVEDGQPLKVTLVNYGKPGKRTVAFAIVREKDAEKTFASCVKGSSGMLALLQGPQRRPDIHGRRIGFAGSDEAQGVLAEQMRCREGERNRREYAERMTVGRVVFGPRLHNLAKRRRENGLGEVRLDEQHFVFVGEKNQYGGELSFPYCEEWPGVAHAEELTERVIAREQFLAIIEERLRSRMEALGMSFGETKGNDGAFMYYACPASKDEDGYAKYFNCNPEDAPVLVAFIEHVECAVRARSAMASAMMDAVHAPSVSPESAIEVSATSSEEVPPVVEVPSASRPASDETLARLLARGIGGAGAQGGNKRR